MKSRGGCYDVFIAHSGDATDFAERLENRLAAAKLHVFLDRRELVQGGPFDTDIVEAVKRCRAFLFVLSARSVDEDSYARSELSWARAAQRQVFFIHAPGCDGLRPPPALDGVTAISTEGDRIAQAVRTLASSLARRRIRPVRLAIALSMLSIALVLGTVLYRSRERTQHETKIAPAQRSELAAPSGMVRIAGAHVTFGGDIPRLARWCSQLVSSAEICDEFLKQVQPRAAAVVGFDIDELEVTAERYAAWISSSLDNRAVTVRGAEIVRTADGARLWQPECHGHGAFRISAGKLQPRAPGPMSPKQPVACVSALGASLYCSAAGKRLPTMDEWELAAGGTSNRFLPWLQTDAVQPTCSDAVFGRLPDGRCSHLPHRSEPVEATNRDVTPEGVRALGGNVSEWVSTQRDATARAMFLAKGGSWAGLPIDLHPTKVMLVDSGSTDFATVGFRCAHNAQ